MNEEWYDELKGEIFDAWGKALLLEIIDPNKYMLISIGPNEIYDQGEGDDITHTFDPYNLNK